MSIFEHKNAIKNIESLPKEILKRYEKCKDIVGLSGSSGLRLIKGFNDEPLQGKWKNYRSSRLDIQYRVIYKIEGTKFLVNVIKVTPHDYKRK